MAMEAANSDVSMLKATEDNYGGMVIDSDALPHDGSVFLASLKQSLMEWKNKGKRGVWLKVPVTMSELVPLAIQEGFEYHHAERTYAMLVTWLAVGHIVYEANEEVLAVQENKGVFQGAGFWKMPTGAVNQGEDIFAGAIIREVKEETGIDTEFVEVVGFSAVPFLDADPTDPTAAGEVVTLKELGINAAAQMKEDIAAAARRKQQTEVEKEERKKRKEIEREEVRRAKVARIAEVAEARTQKLARAAKAAALKAAKAAERLQARRQTAERAIQASEERARKEADRAHVAAMELTLATERAHRQCARAAETA